MEMQSVLLTYFTYYILLQSYHQLTTPTSIPNQSLSYDYAHYLFDNMAPKPASTPLRSLRVEKSAPATRYE